MNAPVQLTERFFAKTRRNEETVETNGVKCLEWTGVVHSNGKGRSFGRYWFEGRMVTAYRISCAAVEGKSLEELDGKVVLHACDNPLCCEGKHLSSGTQQENMKEMFAKGRAGGFVAKHYAN